MQIKHIADLTPDPKNARRHNPRNIGMIERSMGEVGAARSIVIDEDGVILAGNATTEAAAQAGITRVQVVDADGDTIIAVRRSGLTPEQKIKLALADNRAAELAEWEPGVLAELSGAMDLGSLFTADELADVAGPLDSMAATDDERDTSDVDDLPDSTPDALFPSDNEWGIPTLKIGMQARVVDLPVERWGRGSRHNATMPGTFHFYTDDYKFSALWADPLPIITSGCQNIIEPNFSTGDQMPAAVALWGIYRKRWMARWWQEYGVRVFVDLNVEPQFAQLNFLGVPAGWRAYATRAYEERFELIEADFALAASHAQTDDLIFLVMGGGNAARDLCAARGWVWIPQEAHVVEGRYG